jgi:hypothetical protein
VVTGTDRVVLALDLGRLQDLVLLGDGLAATERLVLLVLALRCGEAGATVATVAAIAGDAGLSERGARRSLRRLEASGVIASTPRPGAATVWRFSGRTPEPPCATVGPEVVR